MTPATPDPSQQIQPPALPTPEKTSAIPPGLIPRKELLVIAGIVGTTCMIAFPFFNKAPKKRPTAQQQEQTQTTQNAATSLEHHQMNWEQQTDALLSPDAMRAEAAQQRGTTPPPTTAPTDSNVPDSFPPGVTPAHVPNPATVASPQGQRPNGQPLPPSAADNLEQTITIEVARRDYNARFAPLVVMSTRNPLGNGVRRNDPEPLGSNPHAQRTSQPPSPTPASVALPAALAPQPVAALSSPATPASFASIAAPQSSPPAPEPDHTQPGTPSNTTAARRAAQNAMNNSSGPGHKLFEGAIIETVLTNRLNGTYAGPVNCMVTTTVWSENRQHILIPQGSRILGEAKAVSGIGQQRLAVVFHRIIMPDGYSVSLDNFTGVNEIGETGLKDQVDNHYRQIFGVSIALGALAGLSEGGTSYGATTSGLDAWRQGFSQETSREATQILDRYLNIMPTIVIREGHRVKVYLTDDLLLPAYEDHRMSHDL